MMLHFGQRPKCTRTKAGAFAQLGYIQVISANEFEEVEEISTFET